jgi:superfamily II DNA or RNA helicase/phage anti-repressor protein
MITTKQIGDSYEYFVLNEIKHLYDQVWHWSNIPEYILYELNIIRNYDMFSKYRYDIGADLVAKKDNIYYFIQCKNFSETILMEHLAGFYFLLHEYNLNGILYYNGKLSQRVKDLSTKKVQFINLPFNNQTIMVNIKNNKLIPKDYQLDAYKQLKNHNKCVLSLPCGMGKTYTASILANHYDNIIILAPLRYLAQQLLTNMSNYLNNQYNPILVSMDGSRDINKIKSYINNKNIFSCTYDSADIMVQLIDQLDNIYLIIDEFHNLSSNNINDDKSNINIIMTNTNKHLYLSATPPKNFIYDHKYEYSWQDAIKNKYICDFNIVIHENNQELYKFSYLLRQLCSNSLDGKLIAKAYFMLKGMMYFGNRKCICYMTCIEKANKIYDILYWMSKLLNIEIESWIITCNTAKTKRANYLHQFKKSTKICVIINVHILDEGIDIPECDSVFITQPNNNIINIVQRMCRANRITENKTKCQIFLWCSKRKTNKILEYLSNNTNGVIDDKVIKLNINNMIMTYKKVSINVNYIDYIIQGKNEKMYDYLVKKTNDIPIDFIKFYADNVTNVGYKINLEKIGLYLEVKKENLKRLLENNFKENKDYIIEQKIQGHGKGKGGNNKKNIMLTYECSKLLCMTAKTKKAEIYRNYYIKLDKLIITSQ